MLNSGLRVHRKVPCSSQYPDEATGMHGDRKKRDSDEAEQVPPDRKKQGGVSRDSATVCRGQGSGLGLGRCLGLALASATWVERRGQN